MPRFTAPSVFFVFASIFASSVFADTIVLDNGTEIKGIVVENYRDRLVVSTGKGERQVPKKDIKNVLYDLEEQNLLMLGDAAMARREYGKAYYYYSRAAELNPDFREARERKNYLAGYFFRIEAMKKLDDVKRRQEVENWPLPAGAAGKDYRDRLKERLGIVIAERNNRIKIEEVARRSPAENAGLKKGDILISVWNRLTGYMPESEVADMLLNDMPGEIKLGIERQIVLEKGKLPKPCSQIIGGKLEMLLDGLTVSDLKPEGPASAAGLKNGDLIVSIDASPTRYMPLREAIMKIEDPGRPEATLTVQRDVTIWRE